MSRMTVYGCILFVILGAPMCVWAVVPLAEVDFRPGKLAHSLFPSGADGQVGSVYVKASLQEFLDGDYAQSARLMGKACEYRDTAARRLMMSRAFERAGDYGGAVENLKRAREMDPLPEIVSEIYRITRSVKTMQEEEQAAAEEALRARLLAERQAAGASSFQEIRQQVIEFTNQEAGVEAPDPVDEPAEDEAKVIDAFVAGLASQSALVRSKSMESLAAMDRPELAPHIAVLLNDEDSFMRIEAAVALGKLRSPHTVVNLLERLFIEDDPTVTEQLISALAKVNNKAAREGLKKFRETVGAHSKSGYRIDEILSSQP